MAHGVHKSLVAPNLSSKLHLVEIFVFNQAFLVFNLRICSISDLGFLKLCSTANFPLQPWSGQTAISFIPSHCAGPVRFLFLVFNPGMRFVVLMHDSWRT